MNYILFLYDSFTSFSHNFQVPNLQDCKLFTMTWAENDGYMLFHAMTISLHVPEWPRANSHGNPERKLPSTKGFVEEYDLRRQWTRQLGFQWNNICEHLQWPIFGKSNSVITKVGPYFRWSRTGSIPAASSCPWRSPQNVFQIPWLDLADQAICWWLDLSQGGFGCYPGWCESNLWYPGDMMHFPIINGQKVAKKNLQAIDLVVSS